MKPSPLDLRHYFVTHSLMSANADFDPEKEIGLVREDVQVDCRVQPPAEGGDEWQVVLNLHQNVGPEKNAPYNFALSITGFFVVHPGWPHEHEELVRTNAPTMLYGASREIVRGLTAQGPFFGLVLPSVSFYPLWEDEKPALTPAAEAAPEPPAPSESLVQP